MQVIHDSSLPISARESFTPSLHAPLRLLLRVFVPFLDELPHETSREAVELALRDFATHVIEFSQSPLFQYE
jgi:hypothetical protein